jgi:Flp pilus assembly pilin Flp
MDKNLFARFAEGLRNLRSDERGAESSEVILVLVLLVLGLMAAFAILRNVLFAKAEGTAKCIEGAATANKC